MNFNGRNFGKTDLLKHSPFVQYWDDAGVNPPPPGSLIMITEDSAMMITEFTGQYMVTEST